MSRPITHYIGSLVACVVLATALAACAGAGLPPIVVTSPASVGEAVEPPGSITVELDIFSGLPNPTWALSAAQREEFLAALAALEPDPLAVQEQVGLGYRGVLVHLDDGEPGQRTSVRFFGGLAQQSVDGVAIVLVDSDRSLERWLVETGVLAQAVDEHLAESIHSENQ